ncbi:metal ABC transporter substrate-binding protein [Blastochloris viridis]|uniref:Putative periplasmic iron-binding protein n=1 Tax=Blastochloris viridis TaxID=1079 RepID=A0A0H5BJ34_BLAVI|nr:metal ABC transporter substrate-binding protein [Blastochloris viridis]ALK09665.1 putative periplasmic iron-binding protein precursor [Blastochloris viridis]BAS00447.1 zinc ABC transporter [Blastochloris viridis]CUU42328.1 putative periplasmic iron-binding protein precursor [Blastochloris viridis]
MFDRRSVLFATVASVLLATGPVAAEDTAAAANPPKIKAVASFSILGDFVKTVGGDRLEVTTLVGANGDAHVYAPSPADAKTLAAAKIVFVNGLNFEGWLDRLVKASGTKATVVTTTTGIAPLKSEHHDDHDHDHGHKDHDHGAFDPHAWQSVANAKVYVANIRDALVAADPAGKDAYEANASAFLLKLDALEDEAKAAIARIPAERRRIITSHDAFQYFEKAYGVEFIAPTGVSTDSEASAKAVAKIITQVKKQNIPAVFLENVTDPRLIKRIAEETGAKVGGTLYSDALTDTGGAAPTYIDMMRHNIEMLTGTLAAS